MVKSILTIASLIAFALTSCQQATKQETKNDKAVLLKTDGDTNLLIGSWVQPNPINNKEMQGFKINRDSTAESINMATLLFKKWWKENDRLVLVSESIGNRLTIIDTTEYEIIKLNEKELEIKGKNESLKYQRQ